MTTATPRSAQEQARQQQGAGAPVIRTAGATGSAEARVHAAFERIAEVDRPEIWILLRPESDVVAEARAIDARIASGERLPLAGHVVAIKDSIDVAGLPTTAACPAYAYTPGETAPAARRLLEAGAVLIGKTNLDQFATGLVGTRSPFGAVRDARRPERVSGGSSSGSAVAVALGLVDIAVGTDTAGSGRVPAAFGGIVGFKPTRGLVPTRGVVPACRSLDCVSVFAPTVAAAEQAIAIMTGPDPLDPTSRAWPVDRPLAAPPAPSVAIPLPAQLSALSPSWQAAFTAACETLRATGARVSEVDLSVFFEAGTLLYGGAFVAERYAAVGEFISTHRDEVDPTVGAIIAAARDITAGQLLADTERLEGLKLRAASTFAGFDALLLPTVAEQPSLAQVEADPIAVNSRLGTFTTFCNLLDLAAIAVPAGEVDGGQFGASVIVPAFADAVAADIAGRLNGERSGDSPAVGVPLVVVGAHLSGLALNHELLDRGCRLIRAVATAPTYRFFALDTQPPKPGLLRVANGGASIVGELWDVPPSQLAGLLAALPPPMVFGQVQLDDGASQVGFLCEAIAVSDATEITHFGGWRAYLART